MNWRPRVRVGIGLGVAMILVIGLLDTVLVWRVQRGPHNGITFLCGLGLLLSLAAVVLLAYKIYDLAQLRYEFDRNRLMIVRAGMRHIVPLESIERIVQERRGDAGSRRAVGRIRSLHWPGCYLGRGKVQGIGWTLFSGVTPPHDQLIVITPTLAYGISVPDLDAFREVFAACRRLGPSADVKHQVVQAPYLHWPIWRDRAAQGLVGAGVLLGTLLFAVLLFRYPSLPDRLPMHYDAVGLVDRIAPRSEAFDLPVISLIAWATNGVLGILFYRRQRMISYLAWSGTLIVQTLFLMALWEVVN